MRRLWRRKRSANGDDAAKAKADTEQKLNDARHDWPAVHDAHDQLAQWIESALRGQRL